MGNRVVTVRESPDTSEDALPESAVEAEGTPDSEVRIVLHVHRTVDGNLTGADAIEEVCGMIADLVDGIEGPKSANYTIVYAQGHTDTGTVPLDDV